MTCLAPAPVQRLLIGGAVDQEEENMRLEMEGLLANPDLVLVEGQRPPLLLEAGPAAGPSGAQRDPRRRVRGLPALPCLSAFACPASALGAG